MKLKDQNNFYERTFVFVVVFVLEYVAVCVLPKQNRLLIPKVPMTARRMLTPG